MYYIEGRTDIFYYIEGRTYRLYYLKGRTDIFYYIEVRTDTIRYTVYNCPDMEKYRVNKIHIGNFIDPIFFVLGKLYTVLRIYPDFATKPHI